MASKVRKVFVAWPPLLTALVAFAFFVSQQTWAETFPIPRADDVEGIQRAVSDLVAGLSGRDGERLRRALHKRLFEHRIARNAPAENGFTTVSGEELIAETALPARRGDRDSAEITVLTLLRDVAAVRVQTASCIRLLHLARVDSAWKIVAILSECDV
jgi:hypothetical protein